MRTFFCVALALSAVASALAQPPRPSPAELAEALQKKYDTVRDFRADFTHAYEGGVLRRKTTERGTVMVKKPGRMRWDYQSPEKKLFVSDGVKIYSYLPAERQVIVGSMPREDQATTPVLFLVGKGRLTRDFTVAHAGDADVPPDAYALTLVPVRREPEYETLTLVVDRQTLELRHLAAQDRQGGTSTFTFTNLKQNVGLSDNLFRFSIPRGVDVITDAQPTR